MIAALSAEERARLLHELLRTTLPAIFGPLDDEALSDLERRVEWVTLRRGEALFRQGDAADGWYVVASGRLQVVAEDAFGEETVLGEIGRGESLGEAALLSGAPRTATPYAVRDTELYRFSAADFEEIAERHPRMLLSISRTLVRRSTGVSDSTRRPTPCVNVAVIGAHPGLDVAGFTARLLASLERLGPTSHLTAARPEIAALAAFPDDHPRWQRFSAWLDEHGAERRFVVLEGESDITPWTRRALREADHVLLVADATRPATPHALERDLFAACVGKRHAQRTLVLLHPPSTTLPRGTARWLDARDVQHHQHLRRDHAADVDRLARSLGGASVGLVLGAGGARGFAHVGVLRALGEARVPVDHIGGASSGALVAALHAMGKSPEEMLDLGGRISAMRPFSEWALPITSIVRGKRVEQIVEQSFGDTAIEDLWIPYFCTSCDLTRFRDVVHERGELAAATLASGALPGVLPPRVHQGSLLVDGGTTHMVPGPQMRDRCRGKLIAVDVSPEREMVCPPDRLPTSWSALWHRLRPGAKRMPTASEVFWRAVAFGTTRKTAAVAANADLFLSPPVERFGTTELGAMREIARIGYEHTKERVGRASWCGSFVAGEGRR